MNDNLHSRMHVVSDETRNLVNLVLDYSRRRTLAVDTPLDHPTTETELKRLAGPTITEEGVGSSRALAIFEHIFAPACITTDHPKYLSFIPSAPTKAAVAFDLVVSASALYGGSWLEGAGVVHAENEVLTWLAGEFGLPAEAGGVFVQGGTIGNLSALVAARDAQKAKLGNEKPGSWVIVCSAEAHSSVASAAAVMDIDVAPVPTGDDGILRPDGVRAALEEHGDAVIAVVATSGTTNFGTIDDIAGIAALKDEFDFWLHIDGAYGLAAMLSPLVRHKFAGVESADSVIVDPHKWLFAPFDCCALLYRDPNLARVAHTQHATYLDVLNDSPEWNPTDYSVGLTRRARGLPFWFSLVANGTQAYTDAIERTLEVTRFAQAEVERRPYVEVVRAADLSVLVFRRLGWGAEEYYRWSDRLLADQTGFVVPTSHDGETLARFAIVNPLTTEDDICILLDSMA